MPRPPIAAAREGMCQARIAKIIAVRAKTMALYNVGSPPGVVVKANVLRPFGSNGTENWEVEKKGLRCVGSKRTILLDQIYTGY
jgi:hypothetical protein